MFTPTAENAERLARRLWRLARTLGSAVESVDDAAKSDWDAITTEPEAYETLILQGTEVVRALRVLAQRMDRAVCFTNGRD